MARKKKNSDTAVVDAAPGVSPVSAEAALSPIASVNDQILCMVDYLRYRDAGLNLPFAAYAPIWAAAQANGVPSPAQLLGAAAKQYGLSEADQCTLLQGYIDVSSVGPPIRLDEFIDAIINAPPGQEPAPTPQEPAPAPQEPAPAPQEPATGALPQEAAPEPAQTQAVAEQAPRRTRRPPGRVAAAVARSTNLGRRVVYRAENGRVIRGVVTSESSDTVSFVDDAGEPWSNVAESIVEFDDGPVSWSISKADAGTYEKMLAKGRGLWPDRGNDEVLMELLRRVAEKLVVVVSIRNALPAPYVDAFAYDESAGNIESAYVAILPPSDTLLKDYVFEIPGLGRVEAKIIVE
jgi:hypothetical protein